MGALSAAARKTPSRACKTLRARRPRGGQDPARNLGWGGSGGAELAVAGVAEAGDDVRVLVEVVVDRRGHDLEREAGGLGGLPVLVLDPMLATGGSLIHCCKLLVDRGCTDVIICCVLAAPEGIQRLADSGLPLRLITASIDQGLNEKAYIVPGLGDAGDRQFGGMPRF